MPQTLLQKLVSSHVPDSFDAALQAGAEVPLRIDQTLTQDATGTLVMLALEAIGLSRVRCRLSVQYVDHNLIQEDNKNPDDHLFLESACRRFGVVFSRPGNGVSHPLHMQYFGRPGETLLGSDSHTCAAGALGMLAIGTGGLEVAMAMAGEPFYLRVPESWAVELTGELPPWVSAKDVILELLRRHGVSGGVGHVIEYSGDGVASLSIWDRHVIANMGAELGATTTIFPSDARTEEFLRAEGRGVEYQPLSADPGAPYARHEQIDLSTLEPLIAKPSSPGKVVPVREVAGEPIYQAYIGSSANPGFRDFAVAASIVRESKVADGVSLDINPSTRDVLLQLSHSGLLTDLLGAGARLHQAGCNGCIGMGQAPATGRNSVRTVPRNFPGRSGTREDSVWLASPETAAASALHGVLTDPRTLGARAPEVPAPPRLRMTERLFVDPLPPHEARAVKLVKGPNIEQLPELGPLPDALELPVLLKVGDDLSTDEILPAGARVLPFRSNIPAISRFPFDAVDPSYAARASQARAGHAVVAGKNYGQGSSREHAALAPRYLGLRAVLALSFARIHHENLVNYGVLPLLLQGPEDLARIQQGDTLSFGNIHRSLRAGRVEVELSGKGALVLDHALSPRQIDVVLRGGQLARLRAAALAGRPQQPSALHR